MSENREIVLPEGLGEGIDSLVVLWFKQPGDHFEKEETLVEVQSEKATFDVPAPFSGTLKEIKVDRGQTAKVGQVIATAVV